MLAVVSAAVGDRVDCSEGLEVGALTGASVGAEVDKAVGGCLAQSLG